MMSNYVVIVDVSSDPGTYMVCIRFTFQNRVWQASFASTRASWVSEGKSLRPGGGLHPP
jgi:hypothetical protein